METGNTHLYDRKFQHTNHITMHVVPRKYFPSKFKRNADSQRLFCWAFHVIVAKSFHIADCDIFMIYMLRN